MKLVLFGIMTCSLFAQKPLPQNWVGSGVGYNPGGAPKTTGWVSMALLLSQTGQLYSYSSYDMVPVKGSVPTTSARTGFATVIRNIGPVWIFGFGTAGMAQNTSLTSAFSGGGIGVWQLKSGLTVELGARVLKAGSVNQTIYEFGLGKSW